MTENVYSVDSINENNTINFDVDSEDDVVILDKKMEHICKEINKNFQLLKPYMNNVNNIIENEYDENFDIQELIGEQFDILFYNYEKIKKIIKKGKKIRSYKESKMKQLEKEQNIIRNTHRYFGIIPK
jgi:hypothetical protein